MIIGCVAMLPHNPIGVKQLRKKVQIRKDSTESPTTLIDARWGGERDICISTISYE